jgi:phosphatidyl-myo-inositol dimannoside synthase
MRARSAEESHGVSAGALRSVLLTPNVLGQDGVSSLSREIVRALPRPAAVISLHDPDGLSAGADDVEMHGAGGGRGAFLAAAAAVSLRCSPATDIVCSHLHLAPAAVLQAWRGARVTAVLCGVEAWVPLRKPEAWALERADLVAISQHTVTRFKNANPAFAAAAVAVCHPGVPDLPSQPNPPDLPDQPDPPGLSSFAPPALIVARMSANERYKGHDELLDVWPALLARKPDARLIVAGDGTDRQRLERRAASLGLSHAVTFVGRVGDDELAALYEQCRFLVMPSRDEGFGLVFLEAMRAGKACVGANGAAAEIIRHGVTGLIVEPGTPDDLAAAVFMLFDEPEACCRFGAAGRQRFLSTFTDACFQARFAHVLERRQPAR